MADKFNIEIEKALETLNPNGMVAKTLRFSEQMTFRMDLLAARMNTTVGRMLITILDDVLPMFDEEELPKKPLRQVTIYRALKEKDVLLPVDVKRLIEGIKNTSSRKTPGVPNRKAHGRPNGESQVRRRVD